MSEYKYLILHNPYGEYHTLSNMDDPKGNEYQRKSYHLMKTTIELHLPRPKDTKVKYDFTMSRKDVRD